MAKHGEDTSHATFYLPEPGTLGTPSGRLPIGSTACFFVFPKDFRSNIPNLFLMDPAAPSHQFKTTRHPTPKRPADDPSWVLATSFVWMNQQSLAFEGCFDVIQSGILSHLQGFLEVFFVHRKGLC